MSESVGLPGSDALAEFLLKDFGEEGVEGEPRTLEGVVDLLQRRGVDELAILGRAAEHVGRHQPQGSPLIEALIRAPSRLLVTLNFDLAAERAARARGDRAVTLGNGRDDLKRVLQILAETSPPSELTVLHLHGSVEEPAEMILGSDGYGRIDSGLLPDVLYELAVRRALVFYGTTLDEPYLLARLQAIPNRNAHVLWCRESDREALTSGRNPILPSRTNIYVETVRHHEDLPATAALFLGTDLPRDSPVPASGVVVPDPDYVTNRLRDRRHPNDPDDLIFASLGMEPKGEVRPDPTEADVVDSPKTIILGEPGAGKSELLKALTARGGSPRTGLLIRLADLRPDRQLGPKQRLSVWAMRGLTSDPEADVGIDALDHERFHFFLDGLDEVPSGLQRTFAAQINELAEEFPRHAFTVSTRPLPSLELLRIDSTEASDWNQFVLAPDKLWRDRFLARREVSLARLYEEMPALEDMEDLLVTPFYLRHIVDLHEAGRLEGQRDIGDLLSTLIDLAIAREQDSLELAGASIRTWLRDVALAAVLAGRRTFSDADLRAFASPDGSDADPIDIARSLEQRLLIAEDEGSFRFHHRLFGEQLAAEALVTRGASRALLDCLVPFVRDGLAGVRPDAVVPVGLACLRSAEWRIAVAERDPTAAARATPSDAPAEEREAALRALWTRARAMQVWVWDYGAGLTDDAEAMSRLLRGNRDSDTAREIEEAVAVGTSQDQGNAIRILSRANADGLEARLRMVLRDPGRNGVVLRQAASAAADGGLTGLIEDIAGMLVDQPDHVVHQTAIHALQDLMGDSPRVDVYMRLMGGPEAGYLLALVLGGIEPEDAMLLLAAYLREQRRNRGDGFWAEEKVPEVFARLRPERLSGKVLAATVDVAVLFDLDLDLSAVFGEADRGAVATRLAELVSHRGLGWWHVARVAALCDHDELVAAGVPSEIVERVQWRREVEAAHAQAAADSGLTRPRSDAHDNLDEDADGGPPPSFGELLEDPESDGMVLSNAQYFAPQTGDLTDAQLAELRHRLAGWWPDKPFQETITRTASDSWQQEMGAAAWVWLGPAAKPRLTPEQWGQLAISGILFAAQTEWLRENGTADGIYQAIDWIGDDGDPDRWAQLLDCCRDPIPNALLVQCADSVEAEAGSDTVRFRLREIAVRIVGSGRDDLAEEIARRQPRFAEVLRPVLAEHGDPHAQAAMLADLMATLDRGELPDEHRLTWMGALGGPELIPDLFGVLRRSYRTSERPARGVVTGFDLHDVVNPTIEAIGRIGGISAVAGYDELIASGGDHRWLRRHREQIAGAVLAADGERFAAIAAIACGIPVLGEAVEL